MDLPASEQLGFTATYLGYSLALAGGFYAAVSWIGKNHLSQESKDNLTLWLWGEYQSTWAHHFCNLFDAVFGDRHLSWRCFWRSSLASFLAVFLLYVLFAEIIGVLGDRALGDLSLWQALLIGAAVNIIPDYLSLFETRWLLKRFERVRSGIGQMAVLIADAVFTGAIIWIAITAFRLLTGATPLSVVEMLALFSVFSLFFYSTFLTSVWAWIYCLSTWSMRLFSRTALNKILDVEHKPVSQVALVGAGLILFMAVALTPAFKTGEKNQVSTIDNLLCILFPGDVCEHLVRLTKDEKKALEYLERACEGGAHETCMDAALSYFGGNQRRAASLLRKACGHGHAISCANLGLLYEKALGTASDIKKAVSLYERACGGGAAVGCTLLGIMYRAGRSVRQNDEKAFKLFQQGCDGGVAVGCLNLGYMYREGVGVVRDDKKAFTLYQRGCDLGVAMACLNLGYMYREGVGVVRDDKKAFTLYQRGCDLGVAMACTNLGIMFGEGKGVGPDYKKAVSHFRKGCDGGHAKGCALLGFMYESGHGVVRDIKKAEELHLLACTSGFQPACDSLQRKRVVE